MTPTREPAAYAELVRLVIVGIVALGWVTLDEPAVNAVASAVAAVLSVVLTYVVRTHVTPVVTTPDEPPPPNFL